MSFVRLELFTLKILSSLSFSLNFITFSFLLPLILLFPLTAFETPSFFRSLFLFCSHSLFRPLSLFISSRFLPLALSLTSLSLPLWLLSLPSSLIFPLSSASPLLCHLSLSTSFSHLSLLAPSISFSSFFCLLQLSLFPVSLYSLSLSLSPSRSLSLLSIFQYLSPSSSSSQCFHYSPCIFFTVSLHVSLTLLSPPP